MGETLTLAGPDAYTVEEVIEMCEKYAGADADVTKVRNQGLLCNKKTFLVAVMFYSFGHWICAYVRRCTVLSSYSGESAWQYRGDTVG